MKCPFCNQDATRVTDSRPVEENNAIRRRRECEHCGKRFTTYERIESIPLMVVKKDNSREPYNRNKIQAGILRSCHKTQVPAEKIEEAMNDIENTIFGLEQKEIKSTVIGEIVMNRLKELEEVAYIRFASIYRDFKDMDSFMRELQNLMNK